MFKLIFQDGKTILENSKEELENNMKNDSVFTKDDSLEDILGIE